MMLLSKKEIKKDIYKYILLEYEKRRRLQQAKILLDKVRTKGHLVDRLIELLISNKLQYRIQDYIACQFFYLKYLPYLPNVAQLCSKNGLVRWNKVGHFFKFKESVLHKRKANSRINKIKQSDLKDLLDLKKKQNFEEQDKKIFFNKIRGFDLCLASTSLYNPQSKYCCKCIFKKQCINILNKKFPYLLKYRLGKIKEITFLKYVRKNKLYNFF